MNNMNERGIYCITCINGKRYIGATNDSFKQRWRNHSNTLKNNKHRNMHMQNDYNIYGVNGFSFEILEICKDDLDNKEIQWIANLNTLDREYGYNLASGGKNPKYLDEVKQRVSLACIGQKNTLGKTHSNETKIKISLTCTGHTRSLGKYKENGTSRYAGVSWHKRGSKWLSQIKVGSKNKYLGSFTDPIDAAKAYDAASFAHYGRIDILNFPKEYEELLCPTTKHGDTVEVPA